MAEGFQLLVALADVGGTKAIIILPWVLAEMSGSASRTSRTLPTVRRMLIPCVTEKAADAAKMDEKRILATVSDQTALTGSQESK